ncbi:hypothetical protein NliqN6_0121 [Naganishia liquefaciens]|uniref:FCP1 homology domain-containing protein n=1 Tax=Naganishia liquefaciens TaxID=104408 RepID=A0A8H3TP23_9TREE|nr:hypothetical protein NliqN6_0121 [Naganishia liquefaciens]
MSSQDSKMIDSTHAQPPISPEETSPAVSIVTEALPDIEASHPHALSQETSKTGNDACEDPPSVNEPAGERDTKRVKLDGGAEVDAAPERHEEISFDLRMTWAGQGYDFRVQGSDRLYDCKAIIYSLTSVPPERQKIIGLVKGKIPGDETCFNDLAVPAHRHKFTLIGTPQDKTFVDPSDVDPKMLPDVMDDFDVSYKGQGVKPADDPRNQRLVQHRIEKCQIDIMNEPREGKGLLVLDLDYTIVDTEPLLKGSLPTSHCLRPGLHEFLEQVYPFYDIAVWSQTHWRWLESKLVEMGMIGDPTRNYKIAFVTDKTSMFPIFGKRDGKPYKHEVKPLQFIWAKFPQWSAKNTIHIDDSRNFALNPGEGLKIRPYKKAGTPEGARDDQLPKLGRYLVALAKLPDFRTVDHQNWKKYKFPPAQ